MFARVLLIACFGLVLTAGAATYKVGPSRNYKDLNAVGGLLKAGDIVEVDSGNYSGQITFRNSGTAANPITIRGVGAPWPKLATSGGFVGGSVVRFWGHHYVFENFEITANRDTKTARGLHVVADDVTIRSCVVHDVAGQGIQGSDSAGTLKLEAVEIYRCGAGTMAHQIYVATNNQNYPQAFFRMEGCYLHDGLGGNNVKSRAGRSEIYSNWIEGAMYHELDLIGADPAGQAPGTADLVREDADVVGNVFRKRPNPLGYVARLGTDTTGASNGRYRFAYNTMVVDAGVKGTPTIFGVNAAVQSLEASNNVIYSPVAPLRLLYGTLPDARTAGANNWISTATTGIPGPWTGTLQGADPGFRDAAALDFTPRADGALFGAAAAAPPSPAAYPFPNPLLLPARQPRTPAAPATERPVNGPADIGAFELSDPTPGTPNRPPRAANDARDLIGTSPVRIAVLDNDQDDDGDPITLTSVSRPVYGSVRIDGNAVVFTPGATFRQEILTYRISDGRDVATGEITLGSPYLAVRGVYAQTFAAGEVWAGFAGAVRATVTALGAFTGALQLEGGSFTFSGSLDATGAGSATIARNGLPSVVVTLKLDLPTGSLDATVSAGKKSATITSDRILWEAPTPCPYAGTYTLLLPGPGSRTFPPGNGYATVNIAANGSVQVVGVLGTGTPFSIGTWVHPGGSMPIFISVPTPVRGGVFGTLSFTEGAAAGRFTWWNPKQTVGLYRDAFRVELDASAARWSSASWQGGTAALTIAGGNLPAPLAASIRFAPPTLPSITQGADALLSFDVAAATGLFKGRLLHPVLGKAIDVRGALLQPQALGAGLIVGSTATGSVDLALVP